MPPRNLFKSSAMLAFAFAFSFSFVRPSIANQNLLKPEFTIMAYNVENLFDTVHDEGRNDWTFTPGTPDQKEGECHHSGARGGFLKECIYTNWTQAHLNTKLNQIANAVLKTNNNNLPDILALTEVEEGQGQVIKQLANRLGYSHYFIVSTRDERGISNAVLYNQNNAKFGHAQDISFDLIAHPSSELKTRNILVMHFGLTDSKTGDNVPFTLMVNHWPSQGKRTIERSKIAEAMMKRMEQLKQQNKDMRFIAVGDFNTLASESPNPISTYLLANNCPGACANLVDLYQNLPEELKATYPRGTHYYARDQSWSMLDHILVSQNLINNGSSDNRGVMDSEADLLRSSKMHVIQKSFRIHNDKFLLKNNQQGKFGNNLKPRYLDSYYDNYPYRSDSSSDSSSGSSSGSGKFETNRNESNSNDFSNRTSEIPHRYDFSLPPESPNQGYSDHFALSFKIQL
jgi:predicted extracellular nuclease